MNYKLLIINMILKRNLIIFFLILIASMLSLSSCRNDEGLGGNSSITGIIIEKVYNDDCSILLHEQPAMDEDIYIIFGDHQTIGEDKTTNYNGVFEFDYLFPGDYTVFYYSNDSVSSYEEDIEVKYDITIEKNESFDMGNLYIIKKIDFDDGNAQIKGTVYIINYLNSSVYPNLIVKDTTLAQEQEIYITYGNHEYYDDRIRTQYDGTFEFNNLIKGNYEVFLYSEDISGGTEDIVIMHEVIIDNENQIINLGDIYIEKL